MTLDRFMYDTGKPNQSLIGDCYYQYLFTLGFYYKLCSQTHCLAFSVTSCMVWLVLLCTEFVETGSNKHCKLSVQTCLHSINVMRLKLLVVARMKSVTWLFIKADNEFSHPIPEDQCNQYAINYCVCLGHKSLKKSELPVHIAEFTQEWHFSPQCKIDWTKIHFINLKLWKHPSNTDKKKVSTIAKIFGESW